MAALLCSALLKCSELELWAENNLSIVAASWDLNLRGGDDEEAGHGDMNTAVQYSTVQYSTVQYSWDLNLRGGDH